MKRFLILFVALVLCVGTVGCSGTNQNVQTDEEIYELLKDYSDEVKELQIDLSSARSDIYSAHSRSNPMERLEQAYQEGIEAADKLINLEAPEQMKEAQIHYAKGAEFEKASFEYLYNHMKFYLETNDILAATDSEDYILANDNYADALDEYSDGSRLFQKVFDEYKEKVKGYK